MEQQAQRNRDFFRYLHEDVAAIDEHEKEYEVDNKDLMNQVKTLLGVPADSSQDVAE
jgi:hypothetical protein